MIRFKTDENVHPEVAAFLNQHGHDAMTVWDQALRGRADVDIAAVCRSELRALITFDLGFSDMREYPPGAYAGIVVLRLGSQSRSHVLSAMRMLIPLFQKDPLQGKLWIVQEQEVRIRDGLRP